MTDGFMKNTIAEKWKCYETEFMSSDAPEIQRQEIKHAFFCGAYAILNLQSSVIDIIGSDNDKAFNEIMLTWHQEIKSVCKS